MSKSHRVYRIRGGDINGKVDVTCDEIAEYSGLSKSTIYSRLNRNVFQLEKLTKPVMNRQANKPRPKKNFIPAGKIFLNKPFYDPLYRLMMKTI